MGMPEIFTNCSLCSWASTPAENVLWLEMSHLVRWRILLPPNETYARPEKQKKLEDSRLFQPLPTWNISGFAGFWSFVVFLSCGLCNWSPSQFYGMFWLFSLPKGSPRIVENMRHQEIGPAWWDMGWLFPVENVWRWEMLSVFNRIWNTKSFDNEFSIGYHHEIHTCIDIWYKHTYTLYTVYLYSIYIWYMFFLSGGCWNLWWANSSKARKPCRTKYGRQSFLLIGSQLDEKFDQKVAKIVFSGFQVWKTQWRPRRLPKTEAVRPGSPVPWKWRPYDPASYGIPTQQPNKSLYVFKW